MGNQTVAPLFTFIIDPKPEIKIGKTGGAEGPVTISCLVTDTDLASAEYILDHDLEKGVPIPIPMEGKAKASLTLEIAEPGNYSLRVYAKDQQGNEQNGSLQFKIIHPPKIKFIPIEGRYPDPVKTGFTVSDKGHDLTRVTYQLNTQAPQEAAVEGGNTASASIEVTTPGWNTLTVWAWHKDNPLPLWRMLRDMLAWPAAPD